MPCFCEVPLDAARSHFLPGAAPLLPEIPEAMHLAVALPALENQLDVKIESGFNPVMLPDIGFPSGALANIAMTINMMSGTFTLDDIPMLEMEMEIAADSITRNLWPKLGWLTKPKIQPLIEYSILARLVLDLRALGIDPLDPPPLPPLTPIHTMDFALSPLHVRMAKLLNGLPPIMKMAETLGLPPIMELVETLDLPPIMEMAESLDLLPLGDPGIVPMLQSRLLPLAELTPPGLEIPLPLLTKLAMVLESLATIEEAFGGDAFSPTTLDQVSLMLTLWKRIPIPFALPLLARYAKLDALPPLENILLGERLVGSMNKAFAWSNFSPPKLAIAPFLNVVLALNASLRKGLDIEYLDMCSPCACS
ncbi:hypothetical protein [Rhodospirillum sp. A1_3_36]|uniref:hypothetical protein n=1 Tax=Rhodospirillum sp. A1_3_36 TaxID=3391666 RepID=UPI0039A62C0C